MKCEIKMHGNLLRLALPTMSCSRERMAGLEGENRVSLKARPI